MKAAAAVLFAGLASVSLCSDQKREVRELEEMDKVDPPARVLFPSFSTPRTVLQGNYLSRQVNVGVNGNILGDAANEPSLVVDPTNPNRMAVGWRQFNSVTSNFRQAGWAYTVDGGNTWTFPGVLQNNVFRSDPVLETDISGRFYYLSLMETFFDDIWGSNNQGATWSRIADATGGDKQWMIIDKTNSVGRGNMYQIWSTAGNNWGGRQFSRSTNAGVTWMNPINIPNQPVWGVLDITPTGDLYIGGSDGGTEFYFVRSTNAKNSAVTPTFDRVTTLSLGGSVGFGQVINPDGLSGQTSIVTDKSSSPMGGNIYMLSSVSVNTNNPLDVNFVRSRDGGLSWSTPKRLNDDASNLKRYHWMGTLSIAPNGRLDAVWNDTRADSTNHTSALYYTCSFDGGDSWLPNVQLTPVFDHRLGYPQQNKMGDYLGLLSDDGGSKIAYTATFNGEEDVYYLRVPAPEAISPMSVTLVQGKSPVGGINELKYSDNTVYSAFQDASLPRTVPPLQVEVKGMTTVLNPTQFRFKLEAKVNSVGLSQRVSLFNYVTHQYEQVDARSATTTDSFFTVGASGNLSRFVDQSSGEVKALVSYLQTGATTAALWQGSLDQTQWVVVQ